MKAFQRDFIEFAIERGVLKFGEFTLSQAALARTFSMPVCLIAVAIWLSWGVFTLMR